MVPYITEDMLEAFNREVGKWRVEGKEIEGGPQYTVGRQDDDTFRSLRPVKVFYEEILARQFCDRMAVRMALAEVAKLWVKES